MHQTQTVEAERTAAALRAAGYRVTRQRMVIHRTLVDLDRHVGAEGGARHPVVGVDGEGAGGHVLDAEGTVAACGGEAAVRQDQDGRGHLGMNVAVDLHDAHTRETSGLAFTAWVLAEIELPRPILDRLNAAVNRTIVEPQTKERLEQMGSEGGGGTPEEFAALVRKDSAKWAEVIKKSGAKID